MITKRDGLQEAFDRLKIKNAIWKAAQAVNGTDEERSGRLADEVLFALRRSATATTRRMSRAFKTSWRRYSSRLDTQNTAKAYILYREKRRGTREINALIGATIDMFGDYLNDRDWGVKENANMQRSVNGLNNYVREAFTKKYWLYEIYPIDVCKVHESGDAHIHDLGFFGPYCAGLGSSPAALRRLRRRRTGKWRASPQSICAHFWDRLSTPPSRRRARRGRAGVELV